MKTRPASSTPSDTSAQRSLTCFLDRMLSAGRSMVSDLRASGVDVCALHEIGGPTLPDQDWLARVGRENWIALTADNGIRSNPLALQAIAAASARVFILGISQFDGPTKIKAILRAHPLVQEIAIRYPGPFVAFITKSCETRFVYGGCGHLLFRPATQQQQDGHRATFTVRSRLDGAAGTSL